jgi:hypothetical protein
MMYSAWVSTESNEGSSFHFHRIVTFTYVMDRRRTDRRGRGSSNRGCRGGQAQKYVGRI